VPNTLDPSLHGLDALCIPNIFAGCLSTAQPPLSFAFTDALVDGNLEMIEGGEDSALQNLIGNDAERIARGWADSGRGAEKLAVVGQYLTGTARDAVRRVLGLAPLSREENSGIERAVSMLQRIHDKQRIQACRGGPNRVSQSDHVTESEDEDAHARTAMMLFGFAGTTQIVESQQEKKSQKQQSRPATVPASRVPTPPVSERGFQHLPASRSSHIIHSGPSQGRGLVRIKDTRNACAELFARADARSSPSSLPVVVAHAPSPPFLASSARCRSSASSLGRGDPPLVDLENIPPTNSKRQQPRSQSLSQSQSQSQSQCSASPPLIHAHIFKPATKRRKLERQTVPLTFVDACASVSASTPAQATQTALTENFTAPTGVNENEMGRLDLDVDAAENGRVHHRALRARSRVIEEKLRCALLAPAVSSPA